MDLTPELLEKYPSLQKYKEQGVAYLESNDHREPLLHAQILSHPDRATFASNPAALLSAIDGFAVQTDFLINIGPDKGEVVTSLIAREKPRVMVELGGYVGYSAILFGEAMAKAAAHAEPSGGEASEGKGMGKGGVRFYSIEANPTFAEISRDFVRLAGLENVVSVEVGKAEDVLRQLVSEGKLARGQVDVFFLDHIEELYKQDFRLAWEELGLLRKGSYAVADNVLVPGAPEYRAFVRAQEGRLESYGVKGLIIPGDIEDELEITKIL